MKKSTRQQTKHPMPAGKTFPINSTHAVKVIKNKHQSSTRPSRNNIRRVALTFLRRAGSPRPAAATGSSPCVCRSPRSGERHLPLLQTTKHYEFCNTVTNWSRNIASSAPSTGRHTRYPREGSREEKYVYVGCGWVISSRKK